jgi:hypothetical protein
VIQVQAKWSLVESFGFFGGLFFVGIKGKPECMVRRFVASEK